MSLLTTQQEIKLQRITSLPPIRRPHSTSQLLRPRNHCVFGNGCRCHKFKPIDGSTLCSCCNHDIIWHARDDETNNLSTLTHRLDNAIEENKRLLIKVRKLEGSIKKLEASSKKCIICDENEPNILLSPCNHAHFCENCIKTWSNTNNTCPTCRVQITNKIIYKN